jgi:hypothetical protein
MEKTSVQLDKNSQERLRRRTKVLFVAVLFLIMIAVALIAFLRKAQYQIQDIQVVNAKALDGQVVIDVTKKFLSGNYLFVIPKTNALLVSKSALRRELLDKIPSLEEVRINFIDSNHMTLTLREKEAQYVWCREADCYFMDADGLIYESSPSFSDGVYITFTGGNVPEGSPLRKHFLEVDMFASLVRTLDQLNQFPMTVTGADYGTDITIRIATIQKYILGPRAQIMITTSANESQVAESLGLIVNDKAFANSLETKGAQLEYIDLRFPGKIYYKFSN